MKIEAVEAFPVQAQIAQPFAASVAVGTHTRREALLVRVRTDDGLEGWGETSGPLTVLAAGVRDVLAPALLGQDPLATRTLWLAMLRAARYMPQGLMRAVSAVDVALWDLKGQALQQPIAALLGAAPGGRFPAVATAVFYAARADDLQVRVEQAVQLAETGYRGIKVKVGGLSPDEDARHVAAIRDALASDRMRAVDANCAYRERTAVSMAARLAELGVYWFEEPLPLENVAGYRAVCGASGMYVAGGQALSSAEAFLPLLEARGLHLVQPSVGSAGGITGLQRVVALAEPFGAHYSPTGWGTGIVIAAALHLRAATTAHPAAPFPDLDWIEYDVTDNPLREAVLTTPLVPRDGYLEAPTGPGLGVRVDLDAVRAFAP